MALINRLLPVKTLERVFHLNPRQKRRMRLRREEEERMQKRREEEEKWIQQRREEEEKRMQQRREEEEKRIQQRREEEEKRMQQRREEEEKRIQQRMEEEEMRIQQRREEEEMRIQQRREEEEKRIQQMREIIKTAELLEEKRRLTEAVEHNTMVPIKALPAEMLERVVHLLPPRDQAQVAQVCKDWRYPANHVLLSQARLGGWARLPPSILYRVFNMLPQGWEAGSFRGCLKAVVQVCRRWREVGEAPGLWTWVCLRVGISNRFFQKSGQMPEVLQLSAALDSRRLQAVRRVEAHMVARYWETEKSEELIQVVVRHTGLKEMEIDSTDLSSVDPELLAQAVTQLEEVKLVSTNLTPQQVTAICRAMTGNSQLKTLHIFHNDISSVDADILAQAVAQLEVLWLMGTILTPQQAKAIFAALDTSSQMKELKTHSNLSSVDPDVLARVANKLETADMSNTQLTRQQMTRILTQSLLTTNLKALEIGNMGIFSNRSPIRVLQLAITRVDEELVSQAKLVIPDLKVHVMQKEEKDDDDDDDDCDCGGRCDSCGYCACYGCGCSNVCDVADCPDC